MPGVSSGQHAVATYRMPIDDRGILISPSEPGERYYESDGRGMREPNIYKVGDTYYLFYDGAATHEGHQPGDTDAENHLWRTHLAKSKDLKNWERLGPKLKCGVDDDPQGAEKGYKDFWAHRAHGSITTGTRSIGTPTTWGRTGRPDRGRRRDAGRLLFELSGESRNQRPERNRRRMETNQQGTGKEKSVLFYKGTNGSFPQGITVPGPVIVNPKWQGKKIRST